MLSARGIYQVLIPPFLLFLLWKFEMDDLSLGSLLVISYLYTNLLHAEYKLRNGHGVAISPAILTASTVIGGVVYRLSTKNLNGVSAVLCVMYTYAVYYWLNAGDTGLLWNAMKNRRLIVSCVIQEILPIFILLSICNVPLSKNLWFFITSFPLTYLWHVVDKKIVRANRLELNLIRFTGLLMVFLHVSYFCKTIEDSGAYQFLVLDFFRSFSNLLGLPYIERSCYKIAPYLIWTQIMAFFECIFIYFYLSYRAFTTLVFLLLICYYGTLSLLVVEQKLYRGFNLKHNIFLYIIFALSLSLESMLKNTQGNRTYVSNILALYPIVGMMIQTFRVFNYSVFKGLLAITDEAIFAYTTAKQFFRKAKIFRLIFFTGIQCIRYVPLLLIFIGIHLTIKQPLFNIFHHNKQPVQINISDFECTSWSRSRLLYSSSRLDFIHKSLFNMDLVRGNEYVRNLMQNAKECRTLHDYAILECIADVTENEKYGIDDIHVNWRFGKSHIVSGEKYFVAKRQTGETRLVSYLLVRNINRLDYGIYSCWWTRKGRQNYGSSLKESNGNRHHTKYQEQECFHEDQCVSERLLGVIELKEFITTRRVSESDLGNPVYVHINGMKHYSETVCKANHGTFQISSDTDQISVAPAFGNCFPSVKVASLLRLLPLHTDIDESTVLFKKTIAVFCINSTYIGEHVSELIVNGSVLQGIYPVKHIVLPSPKDVFGRINKKMKRQLLHYQTKLANGSITDNEWDLIRVYSENKFRDEYLFEVLFLIFFIPLICVIVQLMSAINFIGHYLISYTMHWPHDRAELDRISQGGMKDFDLFLSFSEECEEGCAFVREKLLPFLVNETRLKVTSFDDLTPGERLLKPLSDKMASSRKILVVWSAEYNNDLDSFDIQLETLIVSLKKLKLLGTCDVFVLRLAQAHVPLHIQLLGSVIDWCEGDSSEEEKLQKIAGVIQKSLRKDASVVNRIYRLLQWI